MAKEKSCHKFIYKIPSKRLSQSDWKLSLPLQTAIKNKNDVVALGDSQLLRWICELNGIKARNLRVRSKNYTKSCIPFNTRKIIFA